MKKSIAVLGLGRFGSSLAETLYKMGADVLAVDVNEDLVQDFSEKCTSAVCADLEMEENLIELGLNNMDIVVIAMSHNLAASVMSITVAKDQGTPLVLAVASSERMKSILLKVGADQIYDPAGEAGQRSARILMYSSIKDFFKLDDNMYMVEMVPRDDWIGKSLSELQLRVRMNLNVVAVREKNGLWRLASATRLITPDVLLLIVVEKKDIKNLQ